MKRGMEPFLVLNRTISSKIGEQIDGWMGQIVILFSYQCYFSFIEKVL